MRARTILTSRWVSERVATVALAAAAEIADHLCRTAYVSDDQAVWCGTTQREDSTWQVLNYTHGTVGPTVYRGTAGIALFLAEAYRRTGTAEHGTLAVRAVTHALARADDLPSAVRFGWYAGSIGIAHAAVRIGFLLERDDIRSRGEAMLTKLRPGPDSFLLDTVSGAASGAPALLFLSAALQRDDLENLAYRLGLRLIAAARKRTDGWSWGRRATGFESFKPLTGFAHGASGFGWALLELFQHFGDRRFLTGARGAFRYEAGHFQPRLDNWPDFRFEIRPGETPRTSTAWCHGSPGIGLSRLRAMEIDGAKHYQRDALAAVRSSRRVLKELDQRGDTDFSPCHGLGGIVEYLLSAARVLRRPRIGREAINLVLARATQYAGRPGSWPCGVSSGSNPSLMIGFAGIGYLFLRLADPSVPSVLLPVPTLAVAAGRNRGQLGTRASGALRRHGGRKTWTS
jgi:lantibiotic modifying enzyme